LFEIAGMLIAVYRNNFIVQYIMIFVLCTTTTSEQADSRLQTEKQKHKLKSKAEKVILKVNHQILSGNDNQRVVLSFLHLHTSST